MLSVGFMIYRECRTDLHLAGQLRAVVVALSVLVGDLLLLLVVVVVRLLLVVLMLARVVLGTCVHRR